MYNVPGRTGCNMLPETVATLVKKVKNIVGIKEASANLTQVTEIMHLTDGNIDLYSGCDEIIVPTLSVGGAGVISVVSNVEPRKTRDIVAKFLDGDLKGSLEIQLELMPLINALFSEVNPIPVKEALNLMGFNVGSVRMPLTDMEEENSKKLEKIMIDAGLIKG